MTAQEGDFLVREVAPKLKAATARMAQVGADDPQELYADGLAMAARNIRAASAKGKRVTAANVVVYISRALRSGRRSTYAGDADVLGAATQIRGASRAVSAQAPLRSDPDTGDEITFGDLLPGDHQDPSALCETRMDWAAFLAGCPSIFAEMVRAFLEGRSMRDVGREHGIGDSAIGERKRELARRAREFFGPDAVADACRRPVWAGCLVAEREREACRAG